MIYFRGHAGVDCGTVLLPDLIGPIARVHEDEFLLVTQGGFRRMSQLRQAQDCGDGPNSWLDPARA